MIDRLRAMLRRTDPVDDLIDEYLGADDSSDLSALEARLRAAEVDVEELQSVRDTARMIRALETVDAPRSYALTPESLAEIGFSERAIDAILHPRSGRYRFRLRNATVFVPLAIGGLALVGVALLMLGDIADYVVDRESTNTVDTTTQMLGDEMPTESIVGARVAQDDDQEPVAEAAVVVEVERAEIFESAPALKRSVENVTTTAVPTKEASIAEEFEPSPTAFPSALQVETLEDQEGESAEDTVVEDPDKAAMMVVEVAQEELLESEGDTADEASPEPALEVGESRATQKVGAEESELAMTESVPTKTVVPASPTVSRCEVEPTPSPLSTPTTPQAEKPKSVIPTCTPTPTATPNVTVDPKTTSEVSPTPSVAPVPTR